jgi:hypothetical protein
MIKDLIVLYFCDIEIKKKNKKYETNMDRGLSRGDYKI